MRIVDPASAYMDRQGPGRRRWPVFQGGAVFGPGVEGGARQATAEELEWLSAPQEVETAEDEWRHTSDGIDPDSISDAVRELLRQGETTLQGGSTRLTARLVTFWRGDAVLDIRVTSPGVGRGSQTRVSRLRSAGDEQAFAEFIRDTLNNT